MKILVTDIEWDLEDEGEILTPEEAGVPSEFTIEDPDEEMLDEVRNEQYCEAISDLLSDTFGWCVQAFNCRITEENE